MSRLAAAVSLLLAVAACGAPPSRPRVPEPLIVSDRAGAPRVFSLGPDGAGRLIGRGAPGPESRRDCMPARLPDGRIVFVSHRDGRARLFIASPDGGAAVPLLPAGPEPHDDLDPSPLGTDAIVFSRRAAAAPGETGKAGDLHVARLDGVEVRRLTRHPADDRAPAGAPDGRTIVFVSDRDGAPRLYRITDAGDGDVEQTLVPLTSAPAAGDESPAWLPDGEIVFTRRPPGGVPHLFQVPRDGERRGLRQITDSITLPLGAHDPVALADGTILLTTGPSRSRYLVYRIAAGGFNLARVSRAQAPYSDLTRALEGCR